MRHTYPPPEGSVESGLEVEPDSVTPERLSAEPPSTEERDKEPVKDLHGRGHAEADPEAKSSALTAKMIESRKQ